MKTASPKKYFSPLNILYFVLGTLLLGMLLLQVDFQELLGLVASIPVGLLVLGGLIYLCKGLVRAFRFWRINAAARPGFLKMLRLVMATSLASQLMPLKLGELTYIYALRKDFGASVTQGVSTLVIIRVFDLLAISALFVLTVLGMPSPGGLASYLVYIAVLMGLLVLLLLGFVAAGRYFAPVQNWIKKQPFFQKSALLQKLLKTVEGLLDELGKYRGVQYLELAGYPLVEWGLNYAMYAVLLRGIGLDASLLDAVVAVTFAALASLLPVNSFGNFGTQEAGWMTGMMLQGYAQEIALSSGFASHLIYLGYMILLGGVAWISYVGSGWRVPRAAASPAEKH